MEPQKLTTITQHSDYLDSLDISDSEKWRLHCLRKNFGKKSLTFGMFYPCDEDENILTKPTVNHISFNIVHNLDGDIKYKEAKDRTLFKNIPNSIFWDKGCSCFINDYTEEQYHTIESLNSFNLELTEQAIKIMTT